MDVLIYRTASNVFFKGHSIPANTLTLLSGAGTETIQRLIECGAIQPVNAPPLCGLPGWKIRGRKLAINGIDTVAQFWGAEYAQIKIIFGIDDATVCKWHNELQGLLCVAPDKKC
jgi:hypothetical protein